MLYFALLKMKCFMKIKENLYNNRIISIDALRGITIFVMIFVNELASVANVSQWMKHMPADADAMTFVDLVFPAFLFIVGMSVPFAFNARLLKGDSTRTIWTHTFKRALALIIIGVFMVNAEYGYDASKMIITPAFWGLLAYSMPIPIWNKYPKDFPLWLKNTMQYGGILVLITLYFLYIQDTGEIGMTPKWWGILGLIGWAYLFTVVYYWLINGKLWAMIFFLVVCIVANSINLIEGSILQQHSWLNFIAGHLTHASLVTAGVIISLLFFDRKIPLKINWPVIVFAILFFATGYLLRPYFGISKIKGTPSWTMFSAAICTVLFYFLYWLMEIKKQTKWSDFFMPAAANPLLIYILPGIIYYFNLAFKIEIIPYYFREGIPGIIWSLVFSVIMLYVMRIFNRFKIQLHL
jgi:predicted acyltransferase